MGIIDHIHGAKNQVLELKEFPVKKDNFLISVFKKIGLFFEYLGKKRVECLGEAFINLSRDVRNKILDLENYVSNLKESHPMLSNEIKFVEYKLKQLYDDIDKLQAEISEERNNLGNNKGSIDGKQARIIAKEAKLINLTMQHCQIEEDGTAIVLAAYKHRFMEKNSALPKNIIELKLQELDQKLQESPKLETAEKFELDFHTQKFDNKIQSIEDKLRKYFSEHTEYPKSIQDDIFVEFRAEASNYKANFLEDFKRGKSHEPQISKLNIDYVDHIKTKIEAAIEAKLQSAVKDYKQALDQLDLPTEAKSELQALAKNQLEDKQPAFETKAIIEKIDNKTLLLTNMQHVLSKQVEQFQKSVDVKKKEIADLNLESSIVSTINANAGSEVMNFLLTPFSVSSPEEAAKIMKELQARHIEIVEQDYLVKTLPPAQQKIIQDQRKENFASSIKTQMDKIEMGMREELKKYPKIPQEIQKAVVDEFYDMKKTYIETKFANDRQSQQKALQSIEKTYQSALFTVLLNQKMKEKIESKQLDFTKQISQSNIDHKIKQELRQQENKLNQSLQDADLKTLERVYDEWYSSENVLELRFNRHFWQTIKNHKESLIESVKPEDVFALQTINEIETQIKENPSQDEIKAYTAKLDQALIARENLKNQLPKIANIKNVLVIQQLDNTQIASKLKDITQKLNSARTVDAAQTLCKDIELFDAAAEIRKEIIAKFEPTFEESKKRILETYEKHRAALDKNPWSGSAIKALAEWKNAIDALDGNWNAFKITINQLELNEFETQDFGSHYLRMVKAPEEEARARYQEQCISFMSNDISDAYDQITNEIKHKKTTSVKQQEWIKSFERQLKEHSEADIKKFDVKLKEIASPEVHKETHEKLTRLRGKLKSRILKQVDEYLEKAKG